MACAFCRPEDLCNFACSAHEAGDCTGPPAPKNGAIRMTKRNSRQAVPKSIQLLQVEHPNVLSLRRCYCLKSHNNDFLAGTRIILPK
jgi:hypothetical protein